MFACSRYFFVFSIVTVGLVCSLSFLTQFAVPYVYSFSESVSERILSVSEPSLFVSISSSWIDQFSISVFSCFVVPVQLFVYPLFLYFNLSIPSCGFLLATVASELLNLLTSLVCPHFLSSLSELTIRRKTVKSLHSNCYSK